MTGPGTSSALRLSGYLLGFALGGFFDGILLHQILQWHHLLSLVEGVGDLRNQVLFDGLFHALMYVIAAVGLTILLRVRTWSESGPATGVVITASALIGFGVWHLLDAVLSHWLLGIHRIKIDSPNPLLWDLVWLLVFGMLPLALGIIMRRNRGGGSAGQGGRAVALGLCILVLAGGVWAGRSPGDANAALVVFSPTMNQSAAMRAIVASGGSLLWESRGIWAVQWEPGEASGGLYGRGALLVSNSWLSAGCLAWSRS